MRTSVNLDADAYNFVSAYAEAKGITLGSAISELVRRVEQAPNMERDSPRLQMNEHGYFEVVGSEIITPETVEDISEDEVA